MKERNKFEIIEDAIKEDLSLAECPNARIARVCLPAMNQINEDLSFTVEIPEEFEDNRLPTLDFKFWLEMDLINHTYFERKNEDALSANEKISHG